MNIYLVSEEDPRIGSAISKSSMSTEACATSISIHNGPLFEKDPSYIYAPFDHRRCHTRSNNEASGQGMYAYVVGNC